MNPSLLLANATLSSLLGAGLFFLAVLRPTVKLSQGVGLALLAAGGAHIGLSLRDSIPDFFSIILANLLILAAWLSVQHAVMRALNGEGRDADVLGWALAGATLAWLVLFTYAIPDARARSVAVLSASAILCGRIAWMFGSSKRRGAERPLLIAVATVAGLLAAGLAAAAVLVGFQALPALRVLAERSANQWAVIAQMVFVGVLVVLVVALDLRLAARSKPRRRFWALTPPEPARVAKLAEEAIASAMRRRKPFALALVDLDNYKQILDQHGEKVAQSVLRETRDRLTARLRDSDICERFSEDSFLVLLPETTSQAALSVAGQLASLISATGFEAGDETVRASASVGVAAMGLGRARWSELLGAARDALAEARATGRNRAVLAAADFHRVQDRSLGAA